jgi:hypothetical protein
VLAVSERFHNAAVELERPEFIDRRTHPWSVGDGVAWGEAEPPVAHPYLDRLLDIRRPVQLPAQVMEHLHEHERLTLVSREHRERNQHIHPSICGIARVRVLDPAALDQGSLSKPSPAPSPMEVRRDTVDVTGGLAHLRDAVQPLVGATKGLLNEVLCLITVPG